MTVALALISMPLTPGSLAACLSTASAFIGATLGAVKKPSGYWQIASMVTEEGGEARAINLCKRCYNAKLGSAGQAVTKVEGMERGCGKKGSSGRLWKVFGSEQFLRGMWEYFTLKRAWTR